MGENTDEDAVWIHTRLPRACQLKCFILFPFLLFSFGTVHAGIKLRVVSPYSASTVTQYRSSAEADRWRRDRRKQSTAVNQWTLGKNQQSVLIGSIKKTIDIAPDKDC